MSDENPLFRVYLKQLTSGCQAAVCNNSHCKSSPLFVNTDIPNDENNPLARQVAAKLAVDKRNICPNMPPILYRPELFQYVKGFQEFSIAFITNQPINNYIAFVENFFDNLDAFAFCYYDNPDKDLTRFNFQLNDEMLSDFYDATFRRREEIKVLLPKFKSLVLKLSKSQYYSSLYHLRSIIIALSFGSFNIFPNFRSTFLQLLNHINGLNEKCTENIAANLCRLPKFLRRTLATAETNLSLFCLNPKLMISISSNSELKIILYYIRFLFHCSEMMPVPIPISEFSNEPFSNLLRPSVEFQSFFSNQVNFLIFPMVLTLSFKDQIRQHEFTAIQILSENQAIQTNLSDNLRIKVSRKNIVGDTVRQLSNKDDRELKKHLYVEFEGENGVDAGGVSREFIYLATHALFSPDYGMFDLYENRFYWFSLNYEYVDERYFKTLGILVGIAIYNSIILPIRFPIYLYKKLLGKAKCDLNELREFKKDVADNLEKLMKMDDVSQADVTFSIDFQRFGKNETVDLIENGRNIVVTNQTVKEYVKKYIDWTLNVSIEKPYKKFEEGFMLVCKARSLEFLYPEELDILVSGSNVIHWEELKGSTKYQDGYDRQSPTIVMFWEVFDELNEDERKKLLLFTCGTDRVPIDGLKGLNFVIQRTTCIDKLPIAHTCSRTLSLPDYKNIDKVRRNMHFCLYNCEGFDLA